jgi:hypothetical protein
MTEPIITDIKIIMDTLPAWEEEYINAPCDGYDSCSLAAHMGLRRTRASPTNADFHYAHPILGVKVKDWSTVLPSLPYPKQVEAVGELNKILLPGTGRDLYCINYILGHINPGIYKIFIKALIGAVIAGTVSAHVITDCSSVHNKEGLYKKTNRSNIASFKYSPLTSIIIFIRMIQFYNEYSEKVKTEKEELKIKIFTERLAEIEVLKSCTDFSKLYDKPIFVNDGTTTAYVGHPDDYIHNDPIPLDAKVFSWTNNPKEIFDISTALLAGWVTHTGDFERINEILSSIEARF